MVIKLLPCSLQSRCRSVHILSAVLVAAVAVFVSSEAVRVRRGFCSRPHSHKIGDDDNARIIG